jgi:cell division protein ZapA (FtsZ GTPase activity inhibitor)
VADELPITITLAGRPYRLTASRKEEEFVRKAAKNIEGQISQYALNYRHNDKQDLLAMAALHFATIAIHAQNEAAFASQSLAPALASIDSILTEALKD